MLLVRRALLLIFAVIVSAALIFTAFFSYTKITGSANLDASELRFQAEQVLFIILLLTLLVIIIFISLIIRGKNIHREIDKLITQNRLNPASTEQGFLRLGETGKKLNILFAQINEISIKREFKISALSNLVEHLVSQHDRGLFIADISGRIIYTGSKALSLVERTKSEVTGSQIDSIFDGANIQEIIKQIETNKSGFAAEFDGIKLSISPVYDKKNTITYVAVELSK